MSVFSKAIESIIKSFGKEAGQKAGQSASKNASPKSSKATQTKPASTPHATQKSTPAQKQIHKEQRGIYNVTYNDKMATYIKTDLDSIENAIRLARGDKSKGATHIKIRHQQDKAQEGYITQDELLNLGQNIRAFLQKHKQPFVDERGARLYEWKNEKGDKFRIVVDRIKKADGSRTTPQLSQPPAEEIITFYSNRNLPKDKIFEFKNPKLQEINLQKAKSQEAKIKETNLQNPLDSTPKTSFTRQ